MRFSGWAARTAKGGVFMNHNPVVPAHNKASATTYFFSCDIRRSSAAISSGMIWSPVLIVVAGNFTIPTGVISPYHSLTCKKAACAVARFANYHEPTHADNSQRWLRVFV